MKNDIKLFPTLIFTQIDSETGEHMPVDQMGFLYSEDEIKGLFESFLRFYKTIDNETIMTHNEELFERYNNPTKNITKISESKKTTDAFIYLMQDNDNHSVKIGVSKDPKERLSQLQAGNPNLQLIYKKMVEDAYKIEEYLHEKYNHKSIGREWFKLSPNDISRIKSYLNSLTKNGDRQ